MKDFRGQELKFGDTVIYMCTSYKKLYRGTVVNIGEHKVTILCGQGRKTCRYPKTVIKEKNLTL